MRKGYVFSIGPYRYRQRWVPESVLDRAGAEADSDHGVRQVRLADTLDCSRAVENLIHELVECINYQCDMRLPHWKIQMLGLLLGQALQPLIRKWY